MEHLNSVNSIEEKSKASYRKYAVVVPVFVFVFLTFLQILFTDSFYKPGIAILWLTLPSSVVISTIQAFDKKATRSRQIFYSMAFHLILGVFLVFTAPESSGYIFAWILLVFGVQFNIGGKWEWLSYITLVCVQYATLSYRDTISTANIISAAIQFGLVVIISQLMAQSRTSEQRELSELQNSLDRELFERQRLLSLINSLGEAVIATDSKGKILLYNAAVLDLLDTNKSLENEQIDDYLNLKTKAGKKTKLFSLVKKDSVSVSTSDYIHEYAKDDVVNLYINVAPIRLGFKESAGSGYIIILRDITKQKSLEEERDEFISVVSHELRTPVAIAEGNISNAQFANKTKDDPKLTSSSLEQAHKQVVFLANMINDLATLSRAERTDIEIEVTSVDPAALIQSMASDYKSDADEKKLSLTVSVAKNTKPIYTSELYLHEIIQNFITNSLKYTKKGGLILHVRSNKKGDAVFSVADTGIGLSKADQKRVFEKFFRSEDFRTRESSGTGLGLYVTSKLAHRLGAQITVESTLNKGSTFTITCPSMDAPKKHGSKK